MTISVYSNKSAGSIRFGAADVGGSITYEHANDRLVFGGDSHLPTMWLHDAWNYPYYSLNFNDGSEGHDFSSMRVER